ncbi:hypothetical protein ACP4OV_015095 [Aristida adscensionis]
MCGREDEEEEEERRRRAPAGGRGGGGGGGKGAHARAAALRTSRLRGREPSTGGGRQWRRGGEEEEEEDVEKEARGGRRRRPGQVRAQWRRHDGRHAGHEARHLSSTHAVFLPATAPAAAREADVASAAACGGKVDQDLDPGLRRLTKAILKAIEDRHRHEEEVAAAAACMGHSPSWLAALEIITLPSFVVPLAVITTVAVALSQDWLKLEPVDLGEIVKDLYGRRRD